MAEERDQKTEEATSRRREEAREKGQVPLSLELVAAMMLAGWMLGLAFYGGELAGRIGTILAGSLENVGRLGTAELGDKQLVGLMTDVGELVGAALLGLLLPLMLLGVVVGYAQVGFRVTPQAVSFDPSRLDPLKGLERMFSSRSVVKTAQALAKIALIAAVMVSIAWLQVGRITLLGGGELGPVLAGIGYVAARCAAGAIGTVLLLAVVDLVYQRFQHGRDLRMTKQEVRDELKSTEGDPHLRGRIRRVQREMASRRMMADVPTATVVVTNPTHYAVALRYDDEERAQKAAPRVVAKGVDFVAQHIKQLAHEAGVICYEDVPLARALHAQCEIGDQVPVDLYEAVAGVLAYVYRVQGSAQALQGAAR
jgi:flagellar biosynthetic protein FlhB